MTTLNCPPCVLEATLLSNDLRHWTVHFEENGEKGGSLIGEPPHPVLQCTILIPVHSDRHHACTLSHWLYAHKQENIPGQQRA